MRKTTISGKPCRGNHLTFREFFDKVKKYNPNANEKLLQDSYDFAHNAHAGQDRESGDPYFIHPLAVAEILAEMRADSASLSAALLHDCVEDTSVSLHTIKEKFGDEVAMLVEGLTKTVGIQFSSKEEYKAENLRKVLLATTKDIRVILIKLSDRLHNMRTIKCLREDKQRRIAQETLDIFAPIAHKLGMRQIKGDLEDLALKVLDPEAYAKLREQIAGKREEREATAKQHIKVIKETLKKHNVKAEVVGRAKYFYSIYQKMKRQKKDFNEIYDLIAIRIVTESIPECYAALGVVHELWKPAPGRFKDYISVPKANGYQSLHTSVIDENGRILEIQIRTRDMHNLAEEGIAAHWRYKGADRDKRFDQKINWLKQLLEWKQDSNSAKEFVETLKIDLFENEIVVFTPQGDPFSLPENATAVDFAYIVHTSIGDTCSKVEVNRRIVPLDHILKSGDIINVITQKNAKPSRAWLSFVKTSKARSKIKAVLGIKTDINISGRKRTISAATLAKKLDTDIKSRVIKFSKCCAPNYGEPILAFETKDGRVTIHKKDCENVAALDEHRAVVMGWKPEPEADVVKMRVTVKDRVGLLADILNTMVEHRANVISVNTRTKKDRITITFKMRIQAHFDSAKLVKDIKILKDVIDVRGYF